MLRWSRTHPTCCSGRARLQDSPRLVRLLGEPVERLERIEVIADALDRATKREVKANPAESLALDLEVGLVARQECLEVGDANLSTILVEGWVTFESPDGEVDELAGEPGSLHLLLLDVVLDLLDCLLAEDPQLLDLPLLPVGLELLTGQSAVRHVVLNAERHEDAPQFGDRLVRQTGGVLAGVEEALEVSRGRVHFTCRADMEVSLGVGKKPALEFVPELGSQFSLILLLRRRDACLGLLGCRGCCRFAVLSGSLCWSWLATCLSGSSQGILLSGAERDLALAGSVVAPPATQALLLFGLLGGLGCHDDLP